MRWSLLATTLAVGAIESTALVRPAVGAAPIGPILQHVLVSGTDARVVIRLIASGEISGVLKVARQPTRIYVDLTGITPQVQSIVPIDSVAVHRVRIGLNRARPAVTRVVLDLGTVHAYRLERGQTNRELQIVVDGPSRGAEGNVARYVAWFSTIAPSVTTLLQRTSQLRLSDPNASEHLLHVGRDWAKVQRDIDAMTAPEAFRTEHSLLLASVRLGQVAAEKRVEAARLAADASAGEAGAQMLLTRARTAIDLSVASIAPPARP